jgi:hypothetical protein
MSKKTSINPPEWNFPPIIMSPTPKKRSPKTSAKKKTPYLSPFDFVSNLEYSSAQLRTPLNPIYLSKEDKELLRHFDRNIVKPTKRKLVYDIPKKSIKIASPNRQSMNDSEYASTQIITPKKTPKKMKRISIGSIPSDDDQTLPITQF